MKNIFLIVIVLWAQFCESQVVGHKILSVDNNRNNSSDPYLIVIDTIQGDTAKYFRNSNRYVEISKEGVIIVDGQKFGGMGSICGCEAAPHGNWIERYRNGILKTLGSYFCGQRIGKWTTFYKSGGIKKIENLKVIYDENFFKLGFPFDRLQKNIKMGGPYLEYYESGQLKIEGEYEIVEEFSMIDTIFTFDPETYEPIGEIVHGEFWIPRSKKTGNWNEYSEIGEVISQKYYEVNTKNVRTIETRYWNYLEKEFRKRYEKK